MMSIKKILSCILSVAVLLSVAMNVSADYSHSTESEEEPLSFSLPGTEYYSGMDVITDKTHMPYELQVEKLQVGSQGVLLSGTIMIDGFSLSHFEKKGVLVFSDEPFSKETGQISVLFDEADKAVDGFRFLSFHLYSSINPDLLFPVNRIQTAKKGCIIEVAVLSPENRIYYFEGQGDNHIYQVVQKNIHSGLNKQDIIQENRHSSSEDHKTNIAEAVETSDNWRLYVSKSFNDTSKETNTDKISGNEKGISGVPYTVPERVFTTTGKWASVDNPTYQNVGYYAITTDFPGTGGDARQTCIIRWQYVYNKPNDIYLNLPTSTGGMTALNIIEDSEYIYYPSLNSVQKTAYNSSLRIGNAVLAMGLMGDNQLITYYQSNVRSNHNNVTINWMDWIGFIQKPATQIVATFLNSIEYQEYGHKNQGGVFPDTWAGQKQGNNIQTAVRVSSSSYMLYGDGDALEMVFNVCQPRDRPRIVGEKKIANRYYFKVYTKNPLNPYQYNQHLKTVNQIRTCTYNVR